MAIRNLYCVPLIFPGVPEELTIKYWKDVEDQITKLEGTFGQVKKLYHEANFYAEEEGLRNIHRINERASEFINSKVKNGAIVQPLEERETVLEIYDCQLFFTLGLSSKVVSEKVSKMVPEIMGIYEQAIRNRREHIPQQIMDTLPEGETGLLIMREEERAIIQFPPEINVILVMPPVLSEIDIWQKENLYPNAQA